MCTAVKRERKLRSMFNYFLVSLALSDMLSAILVMPLSILRSLIGQSARYRFVNSYVRCT